MLHVVRCWRNLENMKATLILVNGGLLLLNLALYLWNGKKKISLFAVGASLIAILFVIAVMD